MDVYSNVLEPGVINYRLKLNERQVKNAEVVKQITLTIGIAAAFILAIIGA